MSDESVHARLAKEEEVRGRRRHGGVARCVGRRAQRVDPDVRSRPKIEHDLLLVLRQKMHASRLRNASHPHEGSSSNLDINSGIGMRAVVHSSLTGLLFGRWGEQAEEHGCRNFTPQTI
eukprot:4524845-Pleurochrysis_carterae.AAC.2